MKVSIIVPVYNAQNYLKKLNESLINQTYKNIEIIYVNDGSEDGSLAILEDFSRNYDNISVIDQPNQGGSIARNNGLNVAKGDYVFFCDADDYIEKNFIEKMISKALITQADIVVCNYRDVYPNTTIARENKFASNFSGESVIENPKILFIKPAVWNKIFKKSLFIEHKIKFEETQIAQDLCTTLKLLAVAKKISKIDDILYNYVLHDNSISRSYDKRILDIIISVNSLRNFYIDKGLYEKYKNEIDFVSLQNILYQMTKIPLIKEKKDIYKELLSYLKQISTENKYFKKSLSYKVCYFIFSRPLLFMNKITQTSVKFVFTNPIMYKIIRALE